MCTVWGGEGIGLSQDWNDQISKTAAQFILLVIKHFCKEGLSVIVVIPSSVVLIPTPLLGFPAPTSLTAITRKLYAVPGLKFLITAIVSGCLIVMFK